MYLVLDSEEFVIRISLEYKMHNLVYDLRQSPAINR